MPDFIEPNELSAARGAGDEPSVIDVRSPDEYAAGHLEGALNIPLAEVADRLDEIPQNSPVVTYCNMYHPGSSRGEQAAALLESLGFRARTLRGGYPAWLSAEAGEASESSVPNPKGQGD